MVSCFIGGANPRPEIRAKRDEIEFFGYRVNIDGVAWRGLGGIRSFANAFWPGGGRLVGSSGADYGPEAFAIWWAQPNLTSGATARYGIAGVTRDPYGTRLGSVTVKMFRTADDSLQDSVTSDVEGNYTVSSPYTDAHYLYIYKAGPPEMFGGSANTLLPT